MSYTAQQLSAMNMPRTAKRQHVAENTKRHIVFWFVVAAVVTLLVTSWLYGDYGL